MILAVAITGMLPWAVACITSFPFLQVLLAYAPGGVETMTVLSLSLGLDPAFVAGHQLLRFLAVVLISEGHAVILVDPENLKVVNRLLNGFEGKLTASRWARINLCSQDTANRDIRDLTTARL